MRARVIQLDWGRKLETDASQPRTTGYKFAPLNECAHEAVDVDEIAQLARTTPLLLLTNRAELS